MPDISMCKGENCPLKEKCYRFKAIPSEFWQSYFSEIPYSFESNGCEYFWEVK